MAKSTKSATSTTSTTSATTRSLKQKTRYLLRLATTDFSGAVKGDPRECPFARCFRRMYPEEILYGIGYPDLADETVRAKAKAREPFVIRFLDRYRIEHTVTLPTDLCEAIREWDAKGGTEMTAREFYFEV